MREDQQRHRETDPLGRQEIGGAAAVQVIEHRGLPGDLAAEPTRQLHGGHHIAQRRGGELRLAETFRPGADQEQRAVPRATYQACITRAPHRLHRLRAAVAEERGAHLPSCGRKLRILDARAVGMQHRDERVERPGRHTGSDRRIDCLHRLAPGHGVRAAAHHFANVERQRAGRGENREPRPQHGKLAAPGRCNNDHAVHGLQLPTRFRSRACLIRPASAAKGPAPRGCNSITGVRASGYSCHAARKSALSAMRPFTMASR